jgi:hypothetical protein
VVSKKILGRFYGSVKPKYKYRKMSDDQGEYRIVYSMTLPNKKGLISAALNHFKISESDIEDGVYDAPDRLKKRVLRELLKVGWIEETRKRMCERYFCNVKLFTHHLSSLYIARVSGGLFVEIVVVGQYAKQ